MMKSMSASARGTYAATADRFECVGARADRTAAAQTRDDFSDWLSRSFDVDPWRANDLVLALYEALANVVEFAYPSTRQPGTMDVRASYDRSGSTLTVTVSDRGMWRTAPSTPADRTRGRGIALMKALSDRASIQTSTRGTLVSLTWSGIGQRRAA